MAEMIFTIGELCEFTGMSRTGLLATLERARVPLISVKVPQGEKLGLNFGKYKIRKFKKTAWSYYCSWTEPVPLTEDQRLGHLLNSITNNQYFIIPAPYVWREDFRKKDIRTYIVNERYSVTCRLSDYYVRIEDLRIEIDFALIGEWFENFKTFLGLLKKNNRESALREIRFRCFLIDWYFSLSATRHDYDIVSSNRLLMKYKGKPLTEYLQIPIAKINLKYLYKTFPNDEIKLSTLIKAEKELRELPEPALSVILAMQCHRWEFDIGKKKKEKPVLRDIAYRCNISESTAYRNKLAIKSLKKLNRVISDITPDPLSEEDYISERFNEKNLDLNDLNTGSIRITTTPWKYKSRFKR